METITNRPRHSRSLLLLVALLGCLIGTAEVIAQVPETPTNVTAVVTSFNSALIYWQQPEGGSYTIGFTIGGETGGEVAILADEQGGSGSPVTNLPPGNYRFYVRAYNESGYSAWSAPSEEYAIGEGTVDQQTQKLLQQSSASSWMLLGVLLVLCMGSGIRAHQ